MAASDPQLGQDVQRRRVGAAMLGSIGSALEWYDFTLYVYLAPVLADLFFPSSDPLDGLLATYGVFAAGFLMRPLGAVFFGNLGDTRGRKAALSYSVVMMSIAMVLIGLLPTHASIGVAAPIALALLRTCSCSRPRAATGAVWARRWPRAWRASGSCSPPCW